MSLLLKPSRRLGIRSALGVMDSAATANDLPCCVDSCGIGTAAVLTDAAGCTEGDDVRAAEAVSPCPAAIVKRRR